MIPIICGICGEIVMVIGYFAFAAVFLIGSVAAAAMEIPGNLIQAAFGVAVSTVLHQLIKIKIS